MCGRKDSSSSASGSVGDKERADALIRTSNPTPQSQTKLRDRLREKLNPWTLWRAGDEVIPELNRWLKGWGGYFHYAHSTRVLDRMNHLVVNRMQRWLWRKGGGARNLWTTTPREVLQERWGLYRLPTWAVWKRALAQKRCA